MSVQPSNENAVLPTSDARWVEVFADPSADGFGGLSDIISHLSPSEFKRIESVVDPEFTLSSEHRRSDDKDGEAWLPTWYKTWGAFGVGAYVSQPHPLDGTVEVVKSREDYVGNVSGRLMGFLVGVGKLNWNVAHESSFAKLPTLDHRSPMDQAFARSGYRIR